jgi:hypothetical protein
MLKNGLNNHAWKGQVTCGGEYSGCNAVLEIGREDLFTLPAPGHVMTDWSAVAHCRCPSCGEHVPVPRIIEFADDLPTLEAWQAHHPVETEMADQAAAMTAAAKELAAKKFRHQY